MRHATIVVLMLAATVPVFGDQSLVDPKLTTRFGALRTGQSNDPYKRLFDAQQGLKKALEDAQQKTGARPIQPKIVCGMMIVPADPTIDPKMRVTPPQDPNVEYKIRVVEPPICNPAK
jgi:hypothetical protein